jgi:predicted transcriptional regulator of viral defense system
MKLLEQFGVIPVNIAVLKTVFHDYRSLKDKIATLKKSGDLIRLKKGLFVVSSQVSGQALSSELAANHLYGPSYVSLESALSYYGLIPEKVYAVRSVTAKRAKKFSTPLGNFDYVTIPDNYFSIGIRQEIVENKYAFLIAEPTKAVCDMIVATPNLRLQSVRTVQAYLEEDLRIDFSAIEAFDTGIVRQCLETGTKKTEFTYLLKFLEQ